MRSLLLLTAVFTVLLAGCQPRGGMVHVVGRGSIQVVAAESQYGDIATQIGGSMVSVVSLLQNPNTDPHEFEASPAAARSLSHAALVIKNGLGYDTWMDKLLSASPRSGRIVISVGEMLGKHTGDNPHVWYDPAGWAPVASAVERALARLDPARRAYFRQQERAFLAGLQPVRREIVAIRRRAAGAPVTATEPVYGYMASALGFSMRNLDFQRAVMNGTDPAPRAVARMENDLTTHGVRILFYNSQASEPVTVRMRLLARAHHVPVVGVTETEPPGVHFQTWQLRELRAVMAAL